MENIITLEENQTIEINGAVLTKSVIDQIKDFQDSKNTSIEEFRKHIADAICFMAIEAIDYSGIDKESRKERLLSLSAELAYCREALSGLSAPEL